MALRQNKKAVSVMIGYTLLVVFALIISVGVYLWLKSFVPAEPLECPDGVSILLKSANYNSESKELTLELQNNGRFSITGYFVHVATNPAEKTPNKDISPYLEKSKSNADTLSGSVIFLSTEEILNTFKPGDSATHYFSLLGDFGTPLLVRIVPTRQQGTEEHPKFVGCANARTDQEIS